MPFTATLPDGRKKDFPQPPTEEQLRAFAAEKAPAPAPEEPSQPSSFTKEKAIQMVRKEGPQTVGGIYGAARGARAGAAMGARFGPKGALVGGAGGAVLGAFGGGTAFEAGRLGVEAVLETAEAPESLSTAWDQAGSAGLQQALGELSGRGILYGGGKVLNAVRPVITPQAQKALAFLKPLIEKAESLRGLVRKGVRPAALRPAEATENKALDILDNIADVTITSSRVRAQTLAREKVLSDWLNDFLGALGPRVSASDAGNILTAAIRGRWKPWKMAVGTIFNRVANEAREKGVAVSVKAIKAALKEDIAAAQVTKAGGEIGEQLMREVADLPDTIDFATAHIFRSKSLRIQRAALARGEDPRALKRINEVFTKVMEKGLRKDAPDLLPTWRTARELARKTNERFNNKTIKRLVTMVEAKGKPQSVVRSLFTADNVEEIRRAREAVDDETWQTLQRWFMDDILRRATPRGAGFVGEGLPTGAALVDIIEGKGGGSVGRDVISAVFDKGTAESIDGLANALAVVQAKSPDSTGRMLVQLTQGGALINAVRPGGGARKAAAVTLIGPNIIARVMTNQKWANVFIEGINQDATKTGATRITSQLMAAIMTAEREEAQTQLDAKGEQFRRASVMGPAAF